MKVKTNLIIWAALIVAVIVLLNFIPVDGVVYEPMRKTVGATVVIWVLVWIIKQFRNEK